MMMSNQRSPLWPYLLVLVGLFILSVTVPRGWQGDVRKTPDDSVAPPSIRQASRPMSPPAIVTPAPTGSTKAPTPGDHADNVEQAIDDPFASAPEFADSQSRKVHDPVNDSGSHDDKFPLQPLTDEVAQSIADSQRFDAQRRVKNLLSNSLNIPAQPSVTPESLMHPLSTEPSTSVQQETSSVPSRDAMLASGYWPAPRRLFEQLDRLSPHPECHHWAVDVEQACIELCRTPPGESQHAAAIIGKLRQLANDGKSLADAIRSSLALGDLRRACYAIERRLPVWEAVFSTGPQHTLYANVPTGEQLREQWVDALKRADVGLTSIPNGEHWRKYLVWDDLNRIADEGAAMPAEERRLIARRALWRIAAPDANDAQKRILSEPTIQALVEPLRNWASDPMEMHDLLADLEEFEASGLPADARQLAAMGTRLQWSPNESTRRLAEHLEDHYRNANIRLAIAEEFFNRLPTKQPPIKGRVHDTIVGTPVRGTSVTTNEMQISLIPDPARVHLWLEAYGHVDSNTVAGTNTVSFANRGAAHYHVRKAVTVGPRGLGIAPASSEANGQSRLLGVSTQFDGVPLVGSIVRNYALSQHDAMRSEAQFEANRKLAVEAGRRVDAEVNKRLLDAEEKIVQQVLKPLAHLNLELKPIALETTAERATMRFRLAGQHQLAGHTARPQAPSDSLASVQLHESAVNNALDQLELAGRTFTLEELFHHLNAKTGRAPRTLPEGLPDDVFIGFAATDPVRIHCEGGQVHLILSVAELKQGSRRWSDFTITAHYKPETDRLHAYLVRDGAIELGGENYKGRPEVALRGIFSKILSRERKIDLTPAFLVDHPGLADLCVTQFVIDDSWVGIAYGPDRMLQRNNMARRPQGITVR